MKSRLVWMLVLVAAAHVAAARVTAADSAFLVGVLENTPNADSGKPKHPQVRVVFRHTATKGWEALPNDCSNVECLSALPEKYPARVTWTVSLAGLTLGTLSARTPADFGAYASVGLQDIVGKDAVPVVGKPTIAHSGFLDEPRYRPLLATHGRKRPVRSSAGWKEGIPDPEDLDRVWPIFRHSIPRIDNCVPAVETDEEGAEPAPAGRAPKRLELEIPVAWVARNGDALLKVSVREEVFRECDGPRTLPSQLWLLRRSNGQIRILPGQLEADRAELIMPLDFDDLLRDGHDEILFMTAGYNRGGYVLYSDGFRKLVKFSWQYH